MLKGRLWWESLYLQNHFLENNNSNNFFKVFTKTITASTVTRLYSNRCHFIFCNTIDYKLGRALGIVIKMPVSHVGLPGFDTSLWLLT